MQTFKVSILNPKATKLLKSLAELKLISITEQPASGFREMVDRLRKKAATHTPSFEEITEEVESVRSKRYAKSKS
jgi:hypothetical protein